MVDTARARTPRRYFTSEAARIWLAHLARGPFLATVTFYVVVAQA
ncbi:hypothetical protein [Streptomyces sp. NPDC006012]